MSFWAIDPRQARFRIKGLTARRIQMGSLGIPRRWAAFLVCFTSLAAACGGGGGVGNGDGSATAGGAPDKVTIGLFSNSFEFSPILVAGSQGGAFQEVGKTFKTTFEYAYIASGNNLTSALSGGSLQFAVVPGTVILGATDQGLQLTPLVNLFEGTAVQLVAQSKFESSRGTDLKKFDGARYAYPSEGSLAQLASAVALQNAGMDWSKQKHITYGTGGPDSQTLLSTDRTDVLAAGGQPIAKALNQGIGYILYDTQADSKFQYSANMFGVLVTIPSFAQQHPALVQAVATASLKALRSLQTASDPETALKLLPADAQKVNRDLWPTMWRLESSGFKRANGMFTTAGVAASLNLEKASVPLKTPETDVKVFNNKYATQAYKDIGIKPPAV
jgi:ABC-type nitrate/sulfonate/bicarbonate transport system substrate-binding protein